MVAIFCPECGNRTKKFEDRRHCDNCGWYSLKILELFSRTASVGNEFKSRGHKLYTVEIEDEFHPDMTANVLDLTSEIILEEFGKPDVIWASPPCTRFSMAAVGHHWDLSGSKATPLESAQEHIDMIEFCLSLIDELNPEFFFIENPEAMLRYVEFMKCIGKVTITYCQYELEKPPEKRRMKPTNIWSNRIGELKFRDPCHRGDLCHEPSPRGSSSGTQGIKGVTDRGVIPKLFGQELCKQVEDILIHKKIINKTLENMADLIW